MAGPLPTATVIGAAVLVIVPLVAAAWLPPGFPHVARQILLFTWGVGAILAAQRVLFSETLIKALQAVGFVKARRSVLLMALLASVPIWAFLPVFASANEIAIRLRSDWVLMFGGVVLVNGVTEEVIHRGFVFGHLRRGRSFAIAATMSAAVFAAQHLYVIVTTGWTIGLASVLLAVLLAYPLAIAFERGGNSIAAPAILHTSTNAPVLVLELPESFLATALLLHMVVIVVSLYVLFVVLQRSRA